VIRRKRHTSWFCTTGVALALAAAPLQAAESAPPVTAEDEELLEFLGGADGELDEDEDEDEDEWLDFLSNTDIRRIAGAKK
jgi:hypothetical protein